MTSGPITLRQIDGETVTDFIFGASKITVDGDCSHEIKRPSLLGRKLMTNLVKCLIEVTVDIPNFFLTLGWKHSVLHHYYCATY